MQEEYYFLNLVNVLYTHKFLKVSHCISLFITWCRFKDNTDNSSGQKKIYARLVISHNKNGPNVTLKCLFGKWRLLTQLIGDREMFWADWELKSKLANSSFTFTDVALVGLKA